MFKYIKYNFASTPLGNKTERVSRRYCYNVKSLWKLWKRYFLKKNIREAGDVVRIHICSQLMSVFLYAFARLFYPCNLHYIEDKQYSTNIQKVQHNVIFFI